MRAKAWLHWLAIGGLLFGARQLARASDTTSGTPVVVQVSKEATAAQRERAVDEALLIAVAERAGVAVSDPVVRDRLIRNMRFADEQGDALQRALSLGMHRSDPIARRRMLQAGRRLLLVAQQIPVPTPLELERHLAEHQERFASPPRLHFRQIFLSAQRRGDALAVDAEALGRLLSEHPKRDPAALSDASLLPTEMVLADERRIDGRFGRGFTAQLSELEPGRWSRPVRSSFGVHFVWLVERLPGGVPPLSVIVDRVVADWRRSNRPKRLAGALAAIKAHHPVVVEELP